MSRRACVIRLVLIVKCYYLDGKNIRFDRLVGHSVWMRILKETDRLDNKKKQSRKCAFIFIALLLHANLLGYAILWLFFFFLLSYHLCAVAKCVYLQRVVIQVFRRQQFFFSFCEREEMRRVKCILRAKS